MEEMEMESIGYVPEVAATEGDDPFQWEGPDDLEQLKMEVARARRAETTAKNLLSTITPAVEIARQLDNAVREAHVASQQIGPGERVLADVLPAVADAAEFSGPLYGALRQVQFERMKMEG